MIIYFARSHPQNDVNYNYSNEDTSTRSRELLSQHQVTEAINKATKIVQEMEPQLRGILTLDNADVVMVYGKPRTLRKFTLGFISTIAADILKENLIGNLNKYDFANYLNSFDVKGTILDLECPFREEIYRGRECDPMYREIDGFCNNLKNPIWGSSFSPPKRYLPADYGDGLNAPRLSIKGDELPNPRYTSTTVLKTRVIQDSEYTNALMVYGQFMDHEITLTSSPSGDKFGGIVCCGTNVNHPICLPITIPENDYFYSRFKQRCMDNVRSAPSIDKDCRLGVRQHKNEVTSFIDASPVYGSNSASRDSVRLFNKGLLKTQPNPNNPHFKPLLPKEITPSSSQCANQTEEFKCFLAGDERANQNSPLLSIHHMFLRQHNHMVEELSKLNPQWDDEKLYLESRRIVGAIVQHITYKEYLPIILGPYNIKKFRLGLEDTGYFTGYDEAVEASIEQGFAVTAFRFGHSLINMNNFLVTEDRQTYSPRSLRSDFFRPENIYRDRFPNGIDPLLRGLAQQHILQMDNNFSEDVKNHLFEPANLPFGLDLPSLNIMRSREHGIPGYNEWREFCGFHRFQNFESMESEMFQGVPENLAKTFDHADDVDLFVGGVSEIPIDGALVPPTFACILGLQFHSLRYGDRFWYENFHKSGVIDYPFKPEQLQEIRKITLSKITCENADYVPFIQKLMFKQPSL
ncbi:unnamed protein product [Gordionus sp. m RMFG-2023]